MKKRKKKKMYCENHGSQNILHSTIVIISPGSIAYRSTTTSCSFLYKTISTLLTFLGNISVLSFGLQTGWLAPLQPAFQSENSPLSGPPLTDEEISWFGALPSITLTFSGPLFGFLMTKYGRKRALFYATAPNVAAYLLLLANNINLVYISRLIGGFCSCGGFIVGPIYVNELVEPKLKAILGSFSGFFVMLGMILAYILGAYTPYLFVNLFNLSFTVLFLVFYAWLPESPVFLVGIGKILEAKAVLRKLWKGHRKDLIADELKMIQDNYSVAQTDLSALEMTKKFVTEKTLINATVITLAIFGFQMFSGYPAIIRYAVDIMNDSGTIFSAYNAAIIFAVTQLIFSVVGAFLLDRVGRKALVVYGLVIMAICTHILAVYIYLNEYHRENTIVQTLRFVPTATLVLYFGCFSIGFGTVSFVIIPELFAPETRGYASTILNGFFALSEFFVVKLFPTFSNIIHLYGAVGICTLFSYIGAIFLQWRMFETRGLTYEQIQIKLQGKKEVDYEKEQKLRENRETYPVLG